MKNGLRLVFGGLFLLTGWSGSSLAAENKIQAIAIPGGRIMYANTDAYSPSAPPAMARTASVVPLPGSNDIHALIETIAGNHGIDPALVKAIVKTESNFNRWAISSKGARGLMQLIPGTGARFGVRDFFDPRQNIEGGVRYMKFLLEKFKGNLDLSLAAYNAGENLVQRLGRIPSIPETRDYVRKVRASYGKTTGPAADSAVKVTASGAAPAAPPAAQIFRSIDERGVIHYSNLAPPR